MIKIYHLTNWMDCVHRSHRGRSKWIINEPNWCRLWTVHRIFVIINDHNVNNAELPFAFDWPFSIWKRFPSTWWNLKNSKNENWNTSAHEGTEELWGNKKRIFKYCSHEIPFYFIFSFIFHLVDNGEVREKMHTHTHIHEHTMKHGVKQSERKQKLWCDHKEKPRDVHPAGEQRGKSHYMNEWKY